MANQSFAKTMDECKLMAAGLKKNLERMVKRGIDSGFITEYESSITKTHSLDTEQEQLKAAARTKTGEVKKELKALKSMHAEAKKAVKLEMEPSTWIEFGISDKR
jgi:hypothetical protein